MLNHRWGSWIRRCSWPRRASAGAVADDAAGVGPNTALAYVLTSAMSVDFNGASSGELSGLIPREEVRADGRAGRDHKQGNRLVRRCVEAAQIAVRFDLE